MPPVGFDVELYEDNSGRLFLHPMMGDWVYETDPTQVPTRFAEDAQALYENEVQTRDNWSEEWVYRYEDVHAHLHSPECNIVAEWHNDGPMTVSHHIGHAGTLYITARKNIIDYSALEQKVLAHQYHLQETYETEGTRYVLQKESNSWSLWFYTPDRFADYVYGTTIENVFLQARQKGSPIDQITLDQWHS